MKLAVNIFLLSTVTGLGESVHFARSYRLDLDQLAAVLNGGQMASDISRVKVPKLLHRDFSVHAAIADVLKNDRLIVEAAREAHIASPLVDASYELYSETLELDYGQADMVAIVMAMEDRSFRRGSMAPPPITMIRYLPGATARRRHPATVPRHAHGGGLARAQENERNSDSTRQSSKHSYRARGICLGTTFIVWALSAR
jgi:hypothetical protein